MDHSEALRLRAAERYVLGELSPPLRDEYEEHYFACQDCAGELKLTASFVDGVRVVLPRHEGATGRVAPIRPVKGGWFAWAPRFAIPVFAAVLVLVGYQNIVTIPRLKSGPASRAVEGDLVPLIGANSRGESVRTIALHANRPAILEVDIPAESQFASYLCRLQGSAGPVVYEGRVSARDARATVYLIVSQGKLQSGRYSLEIVGEGSTGSGGALRSDIERLAFEVEILP